MIIDTPEHSRQEKKRQNRKFLEIEIKEVDTQQQFYQFLSS
jgi:hypothetical protein